MSGILILVVAFLYLMTSIDLLVKGQTALAVTFAAYSISNIGLYCARGAL